MHLHITFIQRFCTESVVGFFSSLSLPWLLCLLQKCFSSIHPELLKSVVIPSMIVNLGLQILTAQSHLLVFLSSRSVSLSLLVLFSLGSRVRAWCCSPYTPDLTLKGGWGGGWMMNTHKIVSAFIYRPSVICQNLYSGQGAFHKRGEWKEGWIFFFPIMHQQQDPNWHRGLDSFSWDKHPVSCLTPSEGNLPGTSIHRSTHACVLLLKHDLRPRGPTGSSPPQLTYHHGQWPHLLWFFTLLHIPMAARVDVPVTPCNCRNHSSCPEKRLWKQLLADEKFMQCYHIFEYPSLLLSLSLSLSLFPLISLSGWCTDDTPVSTAHGSAALLSLICGRILM